MGEVEAEDLLDGLEGQAREQRRALLADLLEQGFTEEQIRRATRDGTILFLPATPSVGGAPSLSISEVAERAGIDLDLLRTLRRAQGLPTAADGDRAFAEGDVEAAEIAARFLRAGVSEEEIVEISRTLGRGLADVAEAMRAVVLRRVIAEPGLGERDIARRFAALSETMAPMAGPLVSSLLHLHLRQLAQGEALSANEQMTGTVPGARETTVCFADLVGFTRMGEEVPADELGRLAARLEAVALEHVDRPVILVKTIGDAVMLVSPEPDPLIDTALAMVAAADAEGEGFPQLRAGMAVGPAVPQGGDWFGRPVNRASRITAVARPGSVLADAAVKEAARSERSWSFAGERRLKGLRDPARLYRVRKAPTTAATAGDRKPRGR